jgi:hypothetical protein
MINKKILGAMIKTAKLIIIKRMTCIANISFKMNGEKQQMETCPN